MTIHFGDSYSSFTEDETDNEFGEKTATNGA